MIARLILGTLTLGLFLTTGCDTTSGGNTHTTVYYGTGYYDPWYYRGCYDCGSNTKVVINPPPGRGDGDWAARPSQPIARPPSGGSRPSASPRPVPSIPSTPRPSTRGGGGRGR
jgi:hypothetical protein